MKKINSSARYGSYSLIVTAVVLVILILLNLAVNMLPESYTSITSEKTDLYKISKTSEAYLKKLENDITVYVVQVDGAGGEYDLMIKKYVELYVELSDRLTVKYVDPEIKPGFLPSYNKDEEFTNEQLSSETTYLVVESEKRSRIIPFSDIVKVALPDSELEAFYQANGYVPYSYEIENCLLSAIDYVTLDVLPTIYYTNTHKETSLDEGFTSIADLENIKLTALDIEKEGKIPSDAQTIIIYSPKTDFSVKEIEALKKFTERGGQIILSTDFNTNLSDRVLKNLYGFVSEYYGMSYKDVLVLEGDTKHVYSQPNYIFATMTDKVPSEIITGQEGYVLFAFAHAIDIAKELPDGVTVDTLFTTTAQGYAKKEYGKDFTYNKEEGDISGAFTLGAISTREIGDTSSKLWWFSSSVSINTSINPYVAIYAMAKSVDKTDAVSAAAVLITYDRVDISDGAADLWSWIIIAIVPAAILGYGIFIRVTRIRR